MLKALTLAALFCLGGTAMAQETSVAVTFEGCAVCHAGPDDGAAIPAIRGRPEAELLASLQGFAAAPGESTIMHRFAVALTEAEIADLARYISSLEGASR